MSNTFASPTRLYFTLCSFMHVTANKKKRSFRFFLVKQTKSLRQFSKKNINFDETYWCVLICMIAFGNLLHWKKSSLFHSCCCCFWFFHWFVFFILDVCQLIVNMFQIMLFSLFFSLLSFWNISIFYRLCDT